MAEEQQPLLSNVVVDDEVVQRNNINGVSDFFEEFYLESKKLWYLAAPAIFTSLCQFTIGAITYMFAGHLGTIQLAALSVENGVIAAFGFGILVNVFILSFNC